MFFPVKIPDFCPLVEHCIGAGGMKTLKMIPTFDGKEAYWLPINV